MEFGLSTGLYKDLDLLDAVTHLTHIGWFDFEYGVVHIANATEGRWRDNLKSLRGRIAGMQAKGWQVHGPEFGRGDAFDSQERIDNGILWLQYCRVLGVPYLVFHPGRPEENMDEGETLEKNIAVFRQIGKAAQELEVKVAIENIPYRSVMTVQDIKRIVAGVNLPSVGICLDTSHLNMTGQDIPRAIIECGDLLWATHISDNDGSGDQHKIPYNISYRGRIIDWMGVADAIRRVGYDNLFNLEILGEGLGAKTHAPRFVRDLKMNLAKKVLERLFVSG
jgi:sugar phosphate isomerase/epimerase